MCREEEQYTTGRGKRRKGTKPSPVKAEQGVGAGSEESEQEEEEEEVDQKSKRRCVVGRGYLLLLATGPYHCVRRASRVN